MTTKWRKTMEESTGPDGRVIEHLVGGVAGYERVMDRARIWHDDLTTRKTTTMMWTRLSREWWRRYCIVCAMTLDSDQILDHTPSCLYFFILWDGFLVRFAVPF